jgi:hypothetical protein
LRNLDTVTNQLASDPFMDTAKTFAAFQLTAEHHREVADRIAYAVEAVAVGVLAFILWKMWTE